MCIVMVVCRYVMMTVYDISINRLFSCNCLRYVTTGFMHRSALAVLYKWRLCMNLFSKWHRQGPSHYIHVLQHIYAV